MREGFWPKTHNQRFHLPECKKEYERRERVALKVSRNVMAGEVGELWDRLHEGGKAQKLHGKVGGMYVDIFKNEGKMRPADPDYIVVQVKRFEKLPTMKPGSKLPSGIDPPPRKGVAGRTGRTYYQP